MNTDTCPMCRSTFDTRRYQLLHCSRCAGEGSNACCILEEHGQDPLCVECVDE